jgi:hypothetical protein
VTWLMRSDLRVEIISNNGLKMSSINHRQRIV